VIPNTNKTYSSEEIGHTLNKFLGENDIAPSHTIWSSIYSVKDDEITIEIYYMRDWGNPKRFDFTEEIKNMEKQIDCRSLQQIFENNDF
jgi:hypothetical protein